MSRDHKDISGRSWVDQGRSTHRHRNRKDRQPARRIRRPRWNRQQRAVVAVVGLRHPYHGVVVGIVFSVRREEGVKEDTAGH